MSMSDETVSTTAQPPKRKRKVGKVESEARAMKMFTMIIDGGTSASILGYAIKEWGITKQQAYIYLTRARELMKAESEATREELLIEHRLHRRDLRQRAADAKDFRAELDAAKDEAKLAALYPGDKNAERFDNMATEQLQAHLAAILGIATPKE